MKLEPAICATVADEAIGLRGYVVVDALVSGRAMGGIRMTPTVTPAELAALARKMTLKLALAELPIGGAKAGIVGDLPHGEVRDACLRRFGRAVAPILRGGIYLGSDQGITYRDRDLVFNAAAFDVRDTVGGSALPCSWPELWRRCESITGHGVCEAAFAFVERRGLSAERRTAVVQGFGAVGRSVARRLTGAGYRLVAVADRLGTVLSPSGLPLDALLAATDRFGTIDRSRLPGGLVVTDAPEAWLDVDAGLLVLAAGGDAIRLDNVRRVRASVVVEGANLPCSDEALGALADAGIPVVPDIVANCGGAAVTALVLTGLAPASASVDALVGRLYEDITRRIRTNTLAVAERAAASRRSMPEVALEVARERARAALDAEGTGRPPLRREGLRA